MKTFFKLLVIAVVFAGSPCFAQSAHPTQESLNKLFELTSVRGMIPKLQEQMDGMMNGMMQSLLSNKAVTPEQQKALDAFRAKVMKIQAEEVNWETLQPKLSEIYQNALTQEDVDGIIAFYQTPAGQSYVKKMPQIMQQTMLMMQSSMLPLMKKIELAGVELKQDLQRIDQK